MVWGGNEVRDRRLLNSGGAHARDWWPPPQCPALSLTAWPERVGRLEEERTSLAVRGQSSFDPYVEEHGALPGGVPGQRWGLGRRLTRSYSHAFDDSLGNTILNVQTSVRREPPSPTK